MEGRENDRHRYAVRNTKSGRVKPGPGATADPAGARKRASNQPHSTAGTNEAQPSAAPVPATPLSATPLSATPLSATSGGANRLPRNPPGGHRPTGSGLVTAIHYAALDLGTNNCRLLVARPTRRGFQVVDAFSRIVRLGEGVSARREISERAIDRALDALRVCHGKIVRHRVARSKLVATEACRVAQNGSAFVERVRDELGMELEVLSPREEAMLAVSGCASLIDPQAEHALVFDIGGGSSELIWLDLTRRRGHWCRSLADRLQARNCIVAWTSLPVGVVSLSEGFDGRDVTEPGFEAMVEHVTRLLEPFEAHHGLRRHVDGGRVHLLGTSGTVTTIAGILLGLRRYDRNRVDGCWLSTEDVRAVTYDLLRRSYEQRVSEPCIGRERADLVLAGCAVLEALLRMWPVASLRVADRGLREGILATLMAEDGHYRKARARPGRRR